MVKAYLGLGSNKGERISFIETALLEIGKINRTIITRCSSVYETEPWGIKDQGDYLNSVAEINTELSAADLLISLKKIESRIGRTETSKWSEREIDIDLLFYGNEIHNNENIHVPHDEIENRKFVLIPMNEIAPDLVHPVLNKSISELLSETSDDLRVRNYTLSKSDK
ncbi:MAG TPA: 2-amino-4-hydroxy-6-hydroxymethyldihydropteridine diphosphokinase [Ignavibacteria bacterium]|nr:2-amino-4-hydroxy-6-hydroxymethyldihydropteridine diphosphokinase [Ignavibacteria bacterium]